MRYVVVVVCLMLACGGSRTERVSVDPVPLPTSPQPVTSGALAPPPSPIAGTYDLDVAATRPYYEERFAKMPQSDQQYLELAMSMLEKMHMTLTLAASGEVTVTMSTQDGAEEQTKQGKWRRDGADVVLATGGKDMRCTLNAAHLSCTEIVTAPLIFTRRR